MRIGAIQKTSLLDFPGKVSAVVFTQGCNFFCPYCHNAGLVLCRDAPLAFTEAATFLTKRQKVLEGVVVTGGEPALQSDLEDFCAFCKHLGYAVKLDTNGSRPEVLERLLELKLVDYVAMDIKADPRQYPKDICLGVLQGAITQSMVLLKECRVAHEVRVPCVAPFIDAESFAVILELTGGSAPIFLQKVRQGRVLDPAFFSKKGRPLTFEEMEVLQKHAALCGQPCHIR